MNKRRWRRAGVLVLAPAALALAAITGVCALGRYLVVADTLQPSDAIIVLDGRTPARELEAAALYHQGLAPRVVVARARDPYEVARALAGEPNPQVRALRVLTRLKVPRTAIEALDRVVENTTDELAADFEHARSRGFGRVILVTSPAHTRRVRVIWNARYQAAVPALVHPTPYDPFDTRGWWRSRRSIEYALHEIAGILHFRVGAPLPTFDHTW
ncbi:MAG TPA: YdcF family protein [Methylomirabilota bacterium]|nr:YdcF family protein [Methylomirabilota bacterium]